jgi:exopolysaccharide biosynthesis operon protein EpsL
VTWGETRFEGSGAAILAACALLFPAAAAAQSSPVSPFVEEKLVRDDNVFRLSSGIDPTPILGTAARGDTYYVTSGGVNLDLTVSRQRFVGGISVNHSHYHRFSALNHTGHDLRGTWLWQWDNDASGELGYTDTSTLASFANVAGTTPDRVKLRHALANGTFLVAPNWKIFAGTNGYEQRNSDVARRVNDVDIVDGELSVSYVTPGGSSLGLSARAESGRFPVLQPIGALQVDNAYKQYRAGIVADWPITEGSRLRGRIDHVSRSYEQIGARDFDGTTARLQYDWKPTSTLDVVAIVQRDISPFEYVRSSFVMVKGLTLRPTYRASATVDLSGSLDFVTRDYLGDASTGLGLAPVRSERLRAASAFLTYRPLRTVTLQLSALRERRTANVAFGDYTANVVSLSGRLAF